MSYAALPNFCVAVFLHFVSFRFGFSPPTTDCYHCGKYFRRAIRNEMPSRPKRNAPLKRAGKPQEGSRRNSRDTGGKKTSGCPAWPAAKKPSRDGTRSGPARGSPAPVLRIGSGRSRRRSGGPVLPVPSCSPGATPVLPGQDRVPTARETGMDPLHPADRSPGRFVPAFPVRKTGAAVRSGLRFHAGMVRREASGARCEPVVGDVRSAQTQLTADRGLLPPWQYPFPARRPQVRSTRETGVRQEIAGLHTATDTATDTSLYPGNFSP